jgi:hypothetical protein
MAHLDGSLSWQGCRLRTGCSAAPLTVAVATADRSDLAKAQARKGGQFASTKPAAERKRKHRDNEDILQDRLEQQIARHKEEITILNATSLASLQKLTAQLAEKETLIRSLRAKNIAKTITRVGTDTDTEPARKKLAGGQSTSTKKRLANILQAFLDRIYNKEAQPQALLSHFERNPDLYKLVVEAIKKDTVSLSSFLAACETHPDWLNPIRKEVVAEIEKFC